MDYANLSIADKMKLARQQEIEYCQKNIDYYIDTYGHIEDKNNTTNIIQPFEMWEAQRKALHSIKDHKLNAILKARQLGFSWLVLHYASWLMLCWEGRTVIGLSRTEEEAKELVRRLEVIFSNMELIVDEKKKQAGWNGPTFTKNALKLEITFPSGLKSVFMGMPSAPGAGRSFTANLIIFDEWAFQAFAEDIWTAGFPTINSPLGGQVVGLSTIERGSFFEQIYTDTDNNFNKIFIPWYADPRRDAKWYEETKKAMGDLITKEYPASVEEALTVPGGACFPEVNEKNTVTDDELKGNLRHYVSIDYGLDMFSAHWIDVDMFGNAQVIREYDKSGMTISEAAGVLLSMNEELEIECVLAPPDLWNRSQESGKSRAQLWDEAGVTLTKTSNDFAAGVAGMKEWLKPRENMKSKLTILNGSAPNLYRCLQKIQKDKKRPNVYAKDPHDLTHDVDSLRYFCVWWTVKADIASENERKRRWTKDLIEDYENASEEIKEIMLAKYGEPWYGDN